MALFKAFALGEGKSDVCTSVVPSADTKSAAINMPVGNWLVNESFPDINVSEQKSSEGRKEPNKESKYEETERVVETRLKKKWPWKLPSSHVKFLEDTDLSQREAYFIDRKRESGALGFSEMNPALKPWYKLRPYTPVFALDNQEMIDIVRDSRRTQKELAKRQKRKRLNRYFSRGFLSKSLHPAPCVSAKKALGDGDPLRERNFISLDVTKNDPTSVSAHQVVSLKADGRYDVSELQQENTASHLETDELKVSVPDSESTRWNQHLKKHPKDVEGWLKYVRLQEWDPFSKEKKANTTERRIAILDKALEANPTSILLGIERLHQCRDIVETKTLVKEWEKWLFLFPNNMLLWKEYFQFMTSYLEDSSVNVVVRAFDKGFQKIVQVGSGKLLTHKPGSEFWVEFLHLFGMYCNFLWNAGHLERAIATWKAFLEFNLFRPTDVPPSALVSLFEPFWDSGAPRIGESGSIGWAKAMKKQNVPDFFSKMDSSSEELSRKEESIASSEVLTTAQKWIEIETLRSQCHFLPFTGSEDDLEDPSRRVPFHDIEGFLLDFSRMDGLALESIWLILKMLGIDKDGTVINAAVPSVPEGLQLPGAKLNSLEISYRLHPKEMSFGFREFVLNTLEQILPTLESKARQKVAVLLIRVMSTFDVPMTQIRKVAKKLIRDAPSDSIELYKELAAAEFEHGEEESGRRILETIVKSKVGTSLSKDTEFVEVLSTYVVLLKREEQLSLLLTILEEKRGDSCGLLKCKAKLESISDELRAQGEDALTGYVHFTFIHALFYYLTRKEGFEAALRVFANAGTIMAEKTDVIRAILVKKLHFVVCHVKEQHLSPAAIRPYVEDALQRFPSDVRFLDLYVQIETQFPVTANLRRHFKAETLDSLPRAVYALWAEATRLRRFGGEDMLTSTGIGNRMRFLLEECLNNNSARELRRTVILWRMYMKLNSFEGVDALRSVYYRAIDSCPLAKDLYMDAITYCPTMIREVLEMMAEKGLRIHLPLEELEVLCEPLPTVDEFLENEDERMEVLKNELSDKSSDVASSGDETDTS